MSQHAATNMRQKKNVAPVRTWHDPDMLLSYAMLVIAILPAAIGLAVYWL